MVQTAEGHLVVQIAEYGLLCRYYEDVADLDISAIINHHARMEDIDIQAQAAQIDSEELNGMASLSSPPSKKKAADRCAWYCCSCTVAVA